jgi:signal peptidase II
MERQKTKIPWTAALLILIAALVAADQLTKFLAVYFLKGQEPLSLIPGVLELRYLENSGAAFGMLQDQQWFFGILTVVFLGLAVWLFRKVPKTGRYLPLMITAAVLVSGAVGNFIDRLAHRYVVDFIYFSLIDFPIFNVADIYVTLSVIALLVLIFFHYKEEDFHFLRKGDGQKKQKEKGEED